MKKTTVSKLKDRQQFKLSQRSDAAWYDVVKKEKGRVTYSSLRSGLSYTRPGKTICFIPKC